MGGSKSKTATTQQQTATTALPAWMTGAGQDLYGQASSYIANNPATAYTGQMTAPTSANQNSASALAASGVGAGQSDLDAARQMTGAAVSQPQQQVRAQTTQAAGYNPAMQQGTGSVTADKVGTDQWNPAAAAQYMSPYQQQVQQNTLATMDQQDAADRSSLDDSVQASKAFGGTRQALQQSELAKNQDLAKQNYVDGSNQDAYNAAQTTFQNDQARALSANQGNQSSDLSAGTTNANLIAQMIAANQGAANTAGAFNANAVNDNSTANADRNLQSQTTNAANQQSMLDRMLSAGGQAGQIGTTASNLNTQQIGNLASTGATDQSTAQAGDDAAYNEALRAQQAPLEQYKDLMSILSGTPRDVTTSGTSSGTSTTKSSGSLLSNMMGLGQLGLSAYSTFSDRRLKRDIKRFDTLPNGLGLYRYGYVWDAPDEPARIGVMADEVAQIAPEALGPIVGGYATVNYAMLGGF